MKKGLKATFMVALMLVAVLSAVVTANAVSISKVKESTISYTSLNGPDIILYKIRPYDRSALFVIGATIKNVGDEEYWGEFGYRAEAWNYRTREFEKSHDEILHGVILPDEEIWVLNGHGLTWSYVPIQTIYRVHFWTLPPFSSSKTEYYRIWGGYGNNPPNWEQITESTANILSRTIDFPFLERFPLFNLILQRFLY